MTQRLLPQVLTFLAFKTNNWACWLVTLATSACIQLRKRRKRIYFTAFSRFCAPAVYVWIFRADFKISDFSLISADVEVWASACRIMDVFTIICWSFSPLTSNVSLISAHRSRMLWDGSAGASHGPTGVQTKTSRPHKQRTDVSVKKTTSWVQRLINIHRFHLRVAFFGLWSL